MTPSAWEGWPRATCLPDHCFCEAIAAGPVAQSANSWSSLAFVVAGLLIAHWSALAGAGGLRNRMASEPVYRQLYGYALVATGLGSFFYHASLTFAGQVTDMTGMYLVITFALLYCMSLARRTIAVTAYLVGNAGLMWFQVSFPDLRRYVFGALVLTVLWLENRRRTANRKWLWRGAGALGLGFVFWVLDITRVVCAPVSPLQGHAAWHLLGALAGWFLFRYYWSERGADNIHPVP
jgi:hypothetical protein